MMSRCLTNMVKDSPVQKNQVVTETPVENNQYKNIMNDILSIMIDQERTKALVDEAMNIFFLMTPKEFGNDEKQIDEGFISRVINVAINMKNKLDTYNDQLLFIIDGHVSQDKMSRKEFVGNSNTCLGWSYLVEVLRSWNESAQTLDDSCDRLMSLLFKNAGEEKKTKGNKITSSVIDTVKDTIVEIHALVYEINSKLQCIVNGRMATPNSGQMMKR